MSAAPRCCTCMDSGLVLGTLSHLPTSAPPLHLPCPRRCSAVVTNYRAVRQAIAAAIDAAHPNAPPDVRGELIEEVVHQTFQPTAAVAA